MKFRKKQRRCRRITRTDADIIATKAMADDVRRGIKRDITHYDAMSDILCGQKSRSLFN